jgi:LPS export ABC transporter protein LptC
MLEFKNITLSGWNKGERQWEIKAKYVEVSKDRRTTIFHKIISGKFYKKNKEVFCFTAEKAVYDSLLSKLEIFGDIEIIGKENLKINTSHLLWDGNKKILEAKTNIFLISGNNTLIASSLVADQEMGILDLKNVFMNIEVEEIKKRVKI